MPPSLFLACIFYCFHAGKIDKEKLLKKFNAVFKIVIEQAPIAELCVLFFFTHQLKNCPLYTECFKSIDITDRYKFILLSIDIDSRSCFAEGNHVLEHLIELSMSASLSQKSISLFKELISDPKHLQNIYALSSEHVLNWLSFIFDQKLSTENMILELVNLYREKLIEEENPDSKDISSILYRYLCYLDRKNTPNFHLFWPDAYNISKLPLVKRKCSEQDEQADSFLQPLKRMRATSILEKDETAPEECPQLKRTRTY